MHVDERAKAKYQMFRSHGPHMVSKKLIQIMSALLPLRRICSGGKLSDRDLTIVSSTVVTVASLLLLGTEAPIIMPDSK